jgi:tetratricopeptide (TPR) repeat protein
MQHDAPGTAAAPDRLESWKEIAAYLRRSERTVRRWEDKEGLPVHRLAHDKRGSVYGYVSELDAWRESRRLLLDAEQPEAPTDAEPDGITPDAPGTGWIALDRWRWSVSAGIVVTAGLVGAVWLFARTPTQPAPTPDPEAVRLVRLAAFSGNAGRTQVETGIRYYQDAVRRDPAYAAAWTGLATGHFVRLWFGEVRSIDAVQQARQEAEEAIRLDPSKGEPWRVLAAASHFVDWDHVKAEALFRRAMTLSPEDPAAASWFADFLLDMQRFDEARLLYKRAHDLAPRWLEPIAFAGHTHYFSGNADLAIVEYQRALESEPNFGLANHFLGRAYVGKGEHERGIALLRKSNELLGRVPFSLGDLGYGLAVGGKRADAEALRSELVGRRANGYYPAFPIAVIEVGLGNHEAALTWLERAADERNLGFYLPSVDPSFDAIRSHPRFRAVLKRANLATPDRP